MAERPKNDASPDADEIAKLKDEVAKHKADNRALEQRLANERKSASEKIAAIEAAAAKERESLQRHNDVLLHEREGLLQRVAFLEGSLKEMGVSAPEKTETKLVFVMRTRCRHKGQDRVFQKNDEYPIADFSQEETEQYKQRGIVAPMVFAVAKPMQHAIAHASHGVDPAWAQAQVPTRPAVPKHIG